MQYALLIYGSPDRLDGARPLDPTVATVLARPSVSGWARLHAAASATTVRVEEGRTLLTDGPFIDSKEFLAGVVLVEADDLDGALEIAHQLQETRTRGAIEVRPILQGCLGGA